MVSLARTRPGTSLPWLLKRNKINMYPLIKTYCRHSHSQASLKTKCFVTIENYAKSVLLRILSCVLFVIKIALTKICYARHQKVLRKLLITLERLNSFAKLKLSIQFLWSNSSNLNHKTVIYGF